MLPALLCALPDSNVSKSINAIICWQTEDGEKLSLEKLYDDMAWYNDVKPLTFEEHKATWEAGRRTWYTYAERRKMSVINYTWKELVTSTARWVGILVIVKIDLPGPEGTHIQLTMSTFMELLQF